MQKELWASIYQEYCAAVPDLLRVDNERIEITKLSTTKCSKIMTAILAGDDTFNMIAADLDAGKA